MKKRDTLPLLMLNDIQPNKELMLTLEGYGEKEDVYESIFNNDSIYMKMIDFKALENCRFTFYEEMEEVRKDVELSILNLNRKNK
jgi:hypothetical protein